MLNLLSFYQLCLIVAKKKKKAKAILPGPLLTYILGAKAPPAPMLPPPPSKGFWPPTGPQQTSL